jgi:hypothetical protein
LITASSGPFFSQDDSQVLTREQSPGAKSLLQPAVSATDFAPPWGQNPSACGLFQLEYRNKHEEFSLR